MPESNPIRLKIIVSKEDGAFKVLNESLEPIAQPIIGLHIKTIIFENFLIQMEVSIEFVKLGISKINKDKNGVGYIAERFASFLDEEGVYEFSIELKRFVRIPD